MSETQLISEKQAAKPLPFLILAFRRVPYLVSPESRRARCRSTHLIMTSDEYILSSTEKEKINCIFSFSVSLVPGRSNAWVMAKPPVLPLLPQSGKSPKRPKRAFRDDWPIPRKGRPLISCYQTPRNATCRGARFGRNPVLHRLY